MAWDCDCEPHDEAPTDYDVDVAALHRKSSRAAIEQITGHVPTGCPWRAYDDPVVIEAMESYAWFESGQLEMAIGADPPAVLVEAIRIYHSALASVRAADMKSASKPSAKR